MNMKKTLGAVIACMLATLPVAAQRVCLWKNGVCFDKIAVASVDSMTIDNSQSLGRIETIRPRRYMAHHPSATVRKGNKCHYRKGYGMQF